MIKKLLLIGCFLSLFSSSLAQTTLSPGDIAIIGVNYDTSPYYELTIVTLAPIAANTQIRISDYWYNENTLNKLTNVQASSGNAVLTSEGAILWQPLSAIPAGTLYKISILQGGNTVIGLPGNVSVTGWSTAAGTPSSQGGDNWFIYQGTSVTDVTNFVFLWGNGSNAIINNTAIVPSQFVTPGSISSLWGTSDLSNNNVTYLPPSLTLGTNAIALTVDPNINGGIGFHADNNIYTGTKSGTKAALLTAICNKDNWDGNETTTYDITPGGANFSGINPIFTVTGANSAPTDIALTASSINENVAANSTVGTLSSTDVDAGNTFTYTLVAGTGSTDNASFNISGSSLRITASPDFETKSSYSVRVRTTDQGLLFFEKTFTITINDLNEAPTDMAISASSINENVAANSTVGTLSSTDADAANTFTYTLVAGAGSTDNASFNISGSSLRITASPDFETKSSYSVRVRTTDQGLLFFEKTFTITINDLNEAPTDMAISASSINENVAANSTVGTLSSTDADAANTFTYTLVAGTGSTDNASFNISGLSLRITASPDFETKSSYSVRVRTTDQGLLFFEKAFTITINDLNEAPTDMAISASSINENVAANSTVGTLSSTDADAANTFTYTLVAGTGSTDNASFNISGSSLRITASPDFETKSSYSVRVRTTDQGLLFFEKTFTITINDLNEAPTDIAISASAINENVAANSTVGTLSSTDADAANTFTYTLVAGTGSTDNAAFNISGSSLRITASPDFETKSSYSVRVRTTDQGLLFFEKTFTITINDLNEAPTDMAISASSINENVAANSTVGTLSSTDADAANTFTYTLVAGTGSTDNASFNISGSSLRITASPDFETKSSYSVRVRTTDQGLLFFEKAFTITINDLNEAPTDIALSASAINENVVANSTVGTLSSTDVDAANTFTYTLVAGTGSTDNASFNISGSSLRITASPDFETKSSYSVRVRTTDQGLLFFEKTFTITINDLNEAPTDIAISASAINENVAANSTVGTLSSTDADAANTFTYTLVAGTGSTDNAAFNISGSSLRITASPDFETKSSYSVRVRTTDQGLLFFEKAFTITINDLNEAPTDIALSASAINENVVANSTVGTLSSTDVDAANTFTYTLVAGTGSTDNASFNISGSSLRITASPDFETKSSYSVRVRTTDQGLLFFEKAFTITINDLNEAPTDIALSASAINENVVANSTVGTLSSTDVDAANTFTYTLVAGTGSTDNAAFNISGSSLRITASPDFETKSSYSVRVRTTDQGLLFFEKTFTITVNDLCDLDNTVTQSAGILTATQTGATYQWYKCSDNSLVGTNSNTYTPTVVGDYKVDITSGSCTVTSTCVTVTTLGNTTFETNSKFVLYPNPSSGIVNINSEADGDFQILNQLGQVMKTFKVNANVINTIEAENLTDGIYFVKDSNKNKSYKLIIKK
ncbi:beta strand repeat-containing protein [Flavobacterium limnophilum]|uniref:beta strand repeat-containing protein n=1 Tax=Flavobacterium limnophilum TaxID=3003262 RepID=UPI002482C851|nr:T9SS type A sorting domain-containing protein [Flavobacterium limnophilum]